MTLKRRHQHSTPVSSTLFLRSLQRREPYHFSWGAQTYVTPFSLAMLQHLQTTDNLLSNSPWCTSPLYTTRVSIGAGRAILAAIRGLVRESNMLRGVLRGVLFGVKKDYCSDIVLVVVLS